MTDSELMPTRPRQNRIAPPVALVAALFVGVLALVLPSSASASEGWIDLRFAGALANANATSPAGAQFGVATRGTAVFDISDFWSLHLGAEAARHFAAKPGDRKLPPLAVHSAFAGFRYNLDVFKYVPYVGLSAVSHLPGPPVEPKGRVHSRVGAKLSVGVDWRFTRYWSTGIIAELHAVDLDMGGFPNYSTVGFNLAYHFRM